jgi:hypothetical protein
LILVQLGKQGRLPIYKWFAGCGGNFSVGFQTSIAANVEKFMTALN